MVQDVFSSFCWYRSGEQFHSPPASLQSSEQSPLNHKEFREKLVSELAALSSTSVAPEVLACLRPACICQSSSRAMLSRVLWVRCQEWEESLCSVQTFRPQSKDICVLYKMQCTLVLGGIQKLLQEMAHWWTLSDCLSELLCSITFSQICILFLHFFPL